MPAWGEGSTGHTGLPAVGTVGLGGRSAGPGRWEVYLQPGHARGALGRVGEPAPRGRAPRGQGQVRGSAQPGHSQQPGPQPRGSLEKGPASSCPGRSPSRNPTAQVSTSCPGCIPSGHRQAGQTCCQVVQAVWGGGLPTGAEGDLGAFPFPFTPSENCQRREEQEEHPTKPRERPPSWQHPQPRSPAPATGTRSFCGFATTATAAQGPSPGLPPAWQLRRLPLRPPRSRQSPERSRGSAGPRTSRPATYLQRLRPRPPLSAAS